MISTLRHKNLNDLLALGDFNGAICVLGSEWRGPGVMPERNDHDTHSYASLLMVCGVLTVEPWGRLKETRKATYRRAAVNLLLDWEKFQRQMDEKATER